MSNRGYYQKVAVPWWKSPEKREQRRRKFVSAYKRRPWNVQPQSLVTRCRQSVSHKAQWSKLSSEQRRNIVWKAQRNRKFTPEGLEALRVSMSESAYQARLAGKKWGAGGWNKGKKTPKLVVARQRKTLKASISAGTFNPHTHFSFARSGVLLVNGVRFYYASGWERERILVLGSSDKVISFQKDPLRIKYRFKGKFRTYIPDFVITHRDGSKVVEELRPARLAETHQAKAKFKAARKFCVDNGLTFRLITSIENLKIV